MMQSRCLKGSVNLEKSGWIQHDHVVRKHYVLHSFATSQPMKTDQLMFEYDLIQLDPAGRFNPLKFKS